MKKKAEELKLPFHKTSIIGMAVRLAIRKQGVTHKEIQTLAKRFGANPQRLFYILRQNGLKTGKMTWELEENQGRLKILKYKVE